MIQVQIASQITLLGVQGIRWVLVDSADACSSAGPTPAEALTAAVSPAAPSAERSLLSAGVLKLGLTGLGLGLALWTTHAWLGAPTAPGLAPTLGAGAAGRAGVLLPIGAAPTPPAANSTPVLRPAVTPAAASAPTESAPPAAVAAPLITAELR
jgi:hypothetical protein